MSVIWHRKIGTGVRFQSTRRKRHKVHVQRILRGQNHFILVYKSLKTRRRQRDIRNLSEKGLRTTRQYTAEHHTMQ